MSDTIAQNRYLKFTCAQRQAKVASHIAFTGSFYGVAIRRADHRENAKELKLHIIRDGWFTGETGWTENPPRGADLKWLEELRSCLQLAEQWLQANAKKADHGWELW